MQQESAEAKTQVMDVSLFECRKSKENTKFEGTKAFREVGWNLKDQKDSKEETSKRLT